MTPSMTPQYATPATMASSSTTLATTFSSASSTSTQQLKLPLSPTITAPQPPTTTTTTASRNSATQMATMIVGAPALPSIFQSSAVAATSLDGTRAFDPHVAALLAPMRSLSPVLTMPSTVHSSSVYAVQQKKIPIRCCFFGVFWSAKMSHIDVSYLAVAVA